MAKPIREPGLILDVYLKVVLTNFISTKHKVVVIVTDNQSDSRIVKEKLISIHSELPEWVGMGITKSVLKETKFLNNNVIFIVQDARYVKGKSIHNIAYMDTTLSGVIPPDALAFGKKVSRLSL